MSSILGRVISLWRYPVKSISVKVTVSTERCVMIGNTQYELGSDVSIMKTLAQANDERFSVCADVITSGTIRCGDIVALADAAAA